ncbi:MAG: glutamate 5-kinase [Bacteroidales bacterium]|nr:glutamate 5-kinase [Candidatus Colimorpha onthohippi]
MEKAGFTEAVIEGLKAVSGNRHRLVVKVGASVLTRADGTLDTTRVSSLVDQIVTLKKNGCEVILVTSGAVACGRSLIPENRKLDDMQQRQLYAAIGQVRLMDMYYRLFIEYGVNVGQMLTIKKNFASQQEYELQKGCIDVMLQSGVLPIINENDTVSVTELMYTDNDELSGLVAEMMGADTLILLDSIDGVQGDGNIISQINPGQSILSEMLEGGEGRMSSMCRTAEQVVEHGIRVLVANGRRENVLVSLIDTPDQIVHTEFLAKKD